MVEQGDCKKVYKIGSGKAYRLSEMLQYIISLCSQQITIEINQKQFRPVDTKKICGDNSLIRNELGWEPEHTVFDALEEMFQTHLK